MASTYLIRSTPSETFNKLTVSCWFKGMADGTQRNFWGLYDNTDSNRFFGLYYSSNGSLYAYWKQDGSLQFTLGTMQKFRDPNAWYHFVMTMDTTLATASDRVKFYLNGERITVFEDSLDTITQNKNVDLMNGTTDGRMQWGGGKISGTQYYWNGSMSHCHMCVGYAYDASAFGSTDSTTGEWKINTSPSVSYGTNGGFWLKDGNQLTDSSTNSNTLTVGGGTLTKTEDNPSNVFATLNPLYRQDHAFSNGNLGYTSSATDWDSACSNICASSGKYYMETKVTATASGVTRTIFGVGDVRDANEIAQDQFGLTNHSNGDSVGYYGSSGSAHKNGSNVGGSFASFTTNDIIGMYVDLDNGYVYFAKNGSMQNSGVPTSGSTGTGGISIATGQTYTFGVTAYGGGASQTNFGNGYFGTTAVSSAGTNASNLGIFEYDVPSGYTALCTKGLNE